MCPVIPYIQCVTEPIKRILNSHNIKVAQKPFQTLGHIFAQFLVFEASKKDTVQSKVSFTRIRV